jgi:hypothetical protein
VARSDDDVWDESPRSPEEGELQACVWLVDWFACESKEAAAACVPAEDDGSPLLVEYHQVVDAHPSAGQSVMVLLPADPPCVRPCTSLAHPERLIWPYPMAILGSLKGIHELSDLELSMRLQVGALPLGALHNKPSFRESYCASGDSAQ